MARRALSTGPYEDLDELMAKLEVECGEDRIHRAQGPAGRHIIWAMGPHVAAELYRTRTGTQSRSIMRLDWQWLEQNMRPSELVTLAREGIVKCV